jgi:hypothetical protein
MSDVVRHSFMCRKYIVYICICIHASIWGQKKSKRVVVQIKSYVRNPSLIFKCLSFCPPLKSIHCFKIISIKRMSHESYITSKIMLGHYHLFLNY